MVQSFQVPNMKQEGRALLRTHTKHLGIWHLRRHSDIHSEQTSISILLLFFKLHRAEDLRNEQKWENAVSFLLFSLSLFFFAFTPERNNFHWLIIKIVETRLISDGKFICWLFIQNPQHISFIFRLYFSLWNTAPAWKGAFSLEK